MATIGSTNLTLVNDRPEVEVLWNGRYRLTFFCDNGNGQTDWYNENKGEIFPAFGALQSVQLGEEGAGDWIAPDGSVYDDMRLVEAGTPFVPSVGKHYVKLVYETLTDAWVQEKDDTTNNDLNGLERVTRVSVALPDTAYTGVIGTTTITKDGTTLDLGKLEVDETDAKWTLTEEWFEHGELSRNEDLEDAKGAISIAQLTIFMATSCRDIAISNSGLARADWIISNAMPKKIEKTTICNILPSSAARSGFDGIRFARVLGKLRWRAAEASDCVTNSLAFSA